jgi:hypothetical protein
MNKKRLLSLAGLMGGFIIYVCVAYYSNLPTINIHYTGFIKNLIPFFIGFYLWELKKKARGKLAKAPAPLIILGLVLIILLSSLPFLLLFAIGISFFIEKKKGLLNEKLGPVRFILLGIILYTSILPFLLSSPLLHSEDYRNLIGEVQIAEDLNDIYPPIAQDQIRIVDQNMALRLGEKTLGADPSLGSQAQLGTFNIQSVNDKLYWVAPLLHSGFFKWYENREGTTAYVMVSATDDSDVRLVQETGGDAVRIKYQPNSMLGDDLSRHIYFNGFMTTGYEDYSFEINDEGKPYWVVTLYKKKIGFRGKDATGVVIVDCGSGELHSYTLEETPDWVDRIQPEYFILNQMRNWGEYVHGVFNLSDKDKLTTTSSSLSLVYGKEGRSFWNTGLTSVGADEGTVGFVLVDTRSKEAFWYKQAGATEYAARQSAEGKVQEKRYNATRPVMYNLAGIPTYLMSLTDDGGLVKMYSAVSVADYTTVEVADSLSELLSNYQGEIYASGSSSLGNNQGTVQPWINREVIVQRISSEMEGGYTSYYMTVVEIPGKILKARARISRELSLTRPGDRVEIHFLEEGDDQLIDLRDFDNLDLR